MRRLVESLCPSPETNVTVCVNYTESKKTKKRNSEKRAGDLGPDSVNTELLNCISKNG